MSSVAAQRPIPSLKGPLTYSVLFHAVLGALLIYSGWTHRGENWAAPGGSMSVGIVGSAPAVPLPRPDLVSPNRTVDNSKGLYKTEPAPELKQPEPDAVPITKFKLKRPPPPKPKEKPKGFVTPPPPKYLSRPSRVLENKTPPPQNAVPYGGGGAPDIPYSSSTFPLKPGQSTQGGLTFGSNGANGEFASQFAWYVQAVQRKVSGNWLQSTIDANITVAPRVIVTFDILRDGRVANAQITRSSGNYSVDTSALRAVQNSSPLNPLPAGYSGSHVSVDFWFDFHR
ncbi:MAG TPA: TonB family protein [Candidatus Acidoferrales bacterium]|nr:TonB family protein [Candidatus Acidoferrales bacterium]